MTNLISTALAFLLPGLLSGSLALDIAGGFFPTWIALHFAPANRVVPITAQSS